MPMIRLIKPIPVTPMAREIGAAPRGWMSNNLSGAPMARIRKMLYHRRLSEYEPSHFG
jgi:hypothetical protein